MKNFSLPLLILASVLVLHGCASVSVISDYDQDIDFNSYKTYAFYKTGIDRARISDLDKKRILRAIETEMSAKGFTKSDEPDLLVSIFTNERVEVDIYNGGWGYGWGWPGYYGFYGPYAGPGFWGPGFYGNSVSTRTEGALYIDLIDKNKKALTWQGKGVGDLYTGKKIEKKEERIREIVAKIMTQYPPETDSED
ncbi:DUF4136 domain-containing protein [Eudoraea sp.]|uniref:DUF4136 domain-containing protein n=1 Tax=Eudoraea sp. TaxID=1979955 RepID=UPI003C762096